MKLGGGSSVFVYLLKCILYLLKGICVFVYLFKCIYVFVQVCLCICSSVFVYLFPNNISSLPFLAGDKNCRQVVQGKCTETINPVSSSSPKSLHYQLPFVMYSSH